MPVSAASILTPTRMTSLMSASKNKKTSVRIGADLMTSIKSLNLRKISIKKMPKIPKVPGGVVRMGQLVVPKRSFGPISGTEAASSSGRGSADAFDKLPGSALPSARRVSVSGWQVR